ncbi:MAG: hypothetical protein GY842_04255 [bacterium]|nr:hypothetical protein [bacterium]
MRQQLFIFSAALMGASSFALADGPDRPGIVHVGERIDPAYFGPGIVEPMKAVFARERQRAADSAKQLADQSDTRGIWGVPSRGATEYAASGEHYVTNRSGDPCMAIGFPEPVDVHGAYFAGQGGRGVWAEGVRVFGYRGDVEVQRTRWFRDLGAGPMWFEMALHGVDRIVIQALPAYEGRGWFAMDDLSYTPVGDEPGGSAATVVLDFEDTNYRQVLSGKGYRGLIWETGPGDIESSETIHSPRIPPGHVADPADPLDSQGTGGLRDTGTLPELGQNFLGVKRGDAGQWSAPPDTCGAVGPDHFLVAVNRTIAAYNKTTGVRDWLSSLGSFYPGSSGGDPRVAFDQHSGRWIVIWTNFSDRVYLTVSSTDDPTGSWFKTYYVVSQGSDAGRWPDYPTLGVDDAGIYTAAYMVGGGGMSLFAVDKAPLIAPSPSLGTVTAFRGLPWEGAIQPAHTHGNPGGEYLVSRQSTTRIRVRQLTGPLTAPVLTELGSATIPSHASPPDAPSLGSGTNLDTVGDRFMNAVYRDGSVWTAHTIGLSGRAACRWYQVDVSGSPSLQQYGTVSDGSLYYFFPGIAVNRFGDVVLGFTGSNASQYAACYYTGRFSSDSPGAMAAPALLKAGQASHTLIDSYGRNRWGDYSLSSVDPDDDETMWTIQEYAHATNVWGTWIGELRLNSDCNENGFHDRDDIAAGTSLDCNGNFRPDECDREGNDCNVNLIPDDCDIAASTSLDCQPDGTPDECQMSGNDCNANLLPDDCDIAQATSVDCQPDGTPDECQVQDNDCNVNTTPDDCEPDCNTNGRVDECDIPPPTGICVENCLPDCNANGQPDACDVPRCIRLWDGFQPNPPFSRLTLMNTVDYDGDGSYWDNPLDTAHIDNRGCQTGQTDDMAVIVAVAEGEPQVEAGYVSSEIFHAPGGVLLPEEQAYSLAFHSKIGWSISSSWDWELVVYDAESEAPVVQVVYPSIESLAVAEEDRGYLLVKDPAGPSAYFNTGVPILLDTCNDVELVLDNVADSVEVYVDGELRVQTTRLNSTARRMDYFHVQPVENVSGTSGSTNLKLDDFELCVTGRGVAPATIPDCNTNGVYDVCDITDGTSRDCNADDIPDECSPPTQGDFDGDDDFDLADYRALLSRDCFSDVCTTPPCAPAMYADPCCVLADWDADGDVDLIDFAEVQRVLGGG